MSRLSISLGLMIDIKPELNSRLLVELSSARHKGFCCPCTAGLINTTRTHAKIGPRLYFTILQNNMDTPFLQ